RGRPPGQALVAAGAGDEADGVQLLVNPPPLRQPDRRRTAHHPARPMARRAERVLHRARLARQDPARRPHAPGDDHGLTYLGIGGWDLGMPRWEGPGRPLAMDADLLAPAPADVVIFKLG